MVEVATFLWLFGWAQSSALVSFMSLMVLYTAVWVFLDSRSLGKRKKIEAYSWIWACGVAICWSLVSLLYLLRRAAIEEHADAYYEPPRWARFEAPLRANALAPVARMDRREILRRVKLVFWSLVCLAVVVLAVGFSVKFVSMVDFPSALSSVSDRAELLFGAASVAMVVLSVVAAIFAVVGWQGLVSRIDERVEQSFAEVAEKQSWEIRGRVNHVAGIIFWRLALKPPAGTGASPIPAVEEVDSRSFLEMAIFYSQQAIEPLEKAQSYVAWIVKNNLAYYLALQGLKAQAKSARRLAAEVYERYQKESENRYLLTYVRVLMQYPESLEELEESRRHLERVASSVDSTKEVLEFTQLYQAILKYALAVGAPAPVWPGRTSEALAEDLRNFVLRQRALAQAPPPPGLAQSWKQLWGSFAALWRR